MLNYTMFKLNLQVFTVEIVSQVGYNFASNSTLLHSGAVLKPLFIDLKYYFA